MTRGRIVRLSKILLFIGYIVLAAVLLSGCDTGNSDEVPVAENAALAVNVEAARAATGYTIQREFIGRVEATRQNLGWSHAPFVVPDEGGVGLDEFVRAESSSLGMPGAPEPASNNDGGA